MFSRFAGYHEIWSLDNWGVRYYLFIVYCYEIVRIIWFALCLNDLYFHILQVVMGSVLDILYNCSHLIGDHVISSMNHCAFVRIICLFTLCTCDWCFYSVVAFY